MPSWLLPEHIEDLLPRQALKLEHRRRQVLDLFQLHGYQLVMPPLLEYLESLLSGTGHDMDLKTFKLVDQLSGRMMGVRADTTPQAARIDAHLLNQQGVTRLCYAGSVLHTLPAGLNRSRQPFQIGAELYGHKGLEADIEVQQLMLDVLQALGIRELQLDIGHSAIFRTLLDEAMVPAAQAEALFHATQAKDIPSLKKLTQELPKHADAIQALPSLYGDADVLVHAADILPAHPQLTRALTELEQIAAYFSRRGITVSIDLAELGGFNYESGVAFAAYAQGAADAIARGGRYDEIGRVFGRARPATGFSLDLKAILELIHDVEAAPGILAPDPALVDEELQITIRALRARGEIVVARLPGHEVHHHELNCNRELKRIAGKWEVVTLE